MEDSMPGRGPVPDTARAVQILSDARRRCLELGITSEDLGGLLLDEAMLAWLISDWSERDVRRKLMEAMGQDVKMWYARARVATGQCDCVQEVHLAGLLEMEEAGQQRPPILQAAPQA
ncbi:hypothetical protein WKR98_12780 [Pigmentiphaga sp. YJ18]|uniref:hypothetical protein n=1 Tax=Pigmentiphaga sp. YJ18 TaxID=3134907 RepID=UPI00310F6112